MAAVCKGHYQCTSLAAAVSLATAIGTTIPDGSTFATIQAESQNVRWRDDGTNPTAGVGQIIAAGDTLVIQGKQLSMIKFIEVTASAKLNIAFYKN